MNAYRLTLELDLKAVDIDRGGEPVLSNINFELRNGEAVQFFGANGAGKSSLLQVIAGLTPPSKGQVLWRANGADIPSSSPPRAALSYIGHESLGKPTLTARENLGFWAKVYGKAREAIVPCLSRAGLEALVDTRVGRFSAGQKRRLDLARCLIAERVLWVLDEPTASLDVQASQLWASELKNHLGRGGCAVIASHERIDIASRDLHLG